MPRRTRYLLTAFSVIAVSGLLFALAYNGAMGERLQAYVQSIQRCEFFSEAQCARHPRCQAYYEPSGGQALVQEFRECRSATPETIVAASLCQQTGGEWRRVKYGRYCNCAKIGKTYAVDKGCQ